MNNQEIQEGMRLALIQAQSSPDPSTQNGAIIKNNIGYIVGSGFNRPPIGFDMKEHFQRPQKYFFIEHAERNAIFSALRLGYSTVGATMICPWFSCADCARAIVEAGIIRIIGLKREDNMTNLNWNDSIIAGNEILDECGVIREYVSYDEKFGIQLLRNGKLMEF